MNIKIQGLQGTGKIYIANTIRNIDINLNPVFLSYICYASTGCVALLINGTTNHQLFNISTQRIFHKPPNDWKKNNISSIIDKHEYLKKMFTLFIDEDSMVGRPFFGLLQI